MTNERTLVSATERRPSVQSPVLLSARGRVSRAKLKSAARELLNERGFRSLRVQDIAERANVANGLFYHYFHDLREIVAEIARDFFAEVLEDQQPELDDQHHYDWIFGKLRSAVERFARNPGILACLFGLAGDYEEFDQIWKENAHAWNLSLANYLKTRAGMDDVNTERMAFMLGAMTEGVIYQALIRRTEDLLEFGGKPEDIADVLAVMCYRAVFLENPPLDHLRAAGRQLITKQGRAKKGGRLLATLKARAKSRVKATK